MIIHELTEFVHLAQQKPKRIIAVAAAEDEEVLESIHNALKANIITPLLVGEKDKINSIAESIGFNLDEVEIINCTNPSESARIAVANVKNGQADILMKGLVKTGDLLKAVLDKKNGLRTKKLLSHIAFFQSPYYHKICCITDVAMNISPDLNQKIEILENAVEACHKIGIAIPKVAIAAAVETVNPRMEATVHADRLKHMNISGLIKGCLIDGPFSIDVAVNKEAALIKEIISEVSGDCDIILAPDIESGNMFYKALNFLGGASTAAIVLGASAPIVLTSRADDDLCKLHSIALATFIN